LRAALVIIPDAEAALTIVNSKSVFRHVTPACPTCYEFASAARRIWIPDTREA
jgi:hypothetical protein